VLVLLLVIVLELNKSGEFMENIGLVVFDLAGTTIEDSGQVVHAFKTVLSTYGFQLTTEQLQSIRGASKREAIRSLVVSESSGKEGTAEERTNQVFNSFRECLSEIYMKQGVKEVPGVHQTFEWLRGQGIRIALNTGFDRWLTDLILRFIGWNDDLIHSVVCGDDVQHGRPAPDLIFHAMKLAGVLRPDQVANVGDTALDLQAGSNAGVKWNIGVLSGAHKEDHLQKFPHTHLILSIADLPALWE
jgi:phosphonatase-like hydrolase